MQSCPSPPSHTMIVTRVVLRSLSSPAKCFTRFSSSSLTKTCELSRSSSPHTCASVCCASPAGNPQHSSTKKSQELPRTRTPSGGPAFWSRSQMPSASRSITLCVLAQMCGARVGCGAFSSRTGAVRKYTGRLCCGGRKQISTTTRVRGCSPRFSKHRISSAERARQYLTAWPSSCLKISALPFRLHSSSQASSFLCHRGEAT